MQQQKKIEHVEAFHYTHTYPHQLTHTQQKLFKKNKNKKNSIEKKIFFFFAFFVFFLKKASVPDSVKAELLQNINKFLQEHTRSKPD